EEVTVVATVVGGRSRPMAARRGSLQEIRISDGTGTLALTFFNQAWREQQLTEGKRGLFAGKVQLYKGVPQLTHPEVQLFDDETAERTAVERADWPIPIYPATGSVPSWRIASAIGIALDTLPDELPEPIPAATREQRGLLGLHEALELVHRPRRDEDWT